MISHLFFNDKLNSRKLRHLSLGEKTEIFEKSKCPNKSNLTENIYWIFYNLEQYPKKCEQCGKDITKFISFNQGYIGRFCSTTCLNNSSAVKTKKVQTSKSKYGTEYPWQNSEIKCRIHQSTLDTLWSSDRFSQFENYELLTCKEDYKSNSKIRWKCKKCDLEFSEWGNNGIKEPECPACFHHSTSSKGHRELLEKIKTFYNGQIKVNDRLEIYPYELDLYFPKERIGIEFHGLYWHSFDKIESDNEKNKHIQKLNLCNNQGIRLIQIFENEWYNKQDIIISRIKSILGLDNIIFARKCTVREISNNMAVGFQEKYHLQGYSVSKIKIGLYFEEELVAVMTFGKPRFNKNFEWELIRYCSKNTIVGGAGKLLSYFEQKYKPKNIISYADRRWSNGNLYYKLGFINNGITSPNYWYFKNTKELNSRVRFQKHKLEKLLDNFNITLSEAQNMFNHGYRRIWDCGNLVFVKKY